MSEVLTLLNELIACPSVTPNDAGCQTIISQRLEALGFSCEHLRFHDVDNLWARRGTSAPLFVFAGHTDVVPPGPLDQWTSPPFEPTVRDGYLYGRGAADMKSGIAAMIIAMENFITQNPNHPGSLALLITSDEEGPSINGTVKVVEHLIKQQQQIDYCIVGEASSRKQLGDTLMIGRRGSLSGKLKIHGKQGHIAYPHIAINPIHKAAPVINELVNEIWDHGNTDFPPTSFQISNVHAGTGAGNVIPGDITIDFNFRFSPELTAVNIKERTEVIIQKHGVTYDLHWTLSGEPFNTRKAKLVACASSIIEQTLGVTPELGTWGGTSDARFICKTGCEIIELGPINETIHQINECININDLEKLSQLYQAIISSLLVS